jgi:hypothetical protein
MYTSRLVLKQKVKRGVIKKKTRRKLAMIVIERIVRRKKLREKRERGVKA